MGKHKKYYAVREGRKPGIYHTWFGPGGAEEQIRGYTGARYKGFASSEEASAWLRGNDPVVAVRRPEPEDRVLNHDASPRADTVIIYTDGSCRGNPGPGGYGAVILEGEKRREIAKGYRRTTNNRMELMGCIAALETLGEPSDVVLHSDSSYVVNGITRGWAQKWRAKNWMRTRTDPAVNADLWDALLRLSETNRVRFVWVRGHAGNRENERCDELALAAASKKDLAVDTVYEKMHGKANGHG